MTRVPTSNLGGPAGGLIARIKNKLKKLKTIFKLISSPPGDTRLHLEYSYITTYMYVHVHQHTSFLFQVYLFCQLRTAQAEGRVLAWVMVE